MLSVSLLLLLVAGVPVQAERVVVDFPVVGEEQPPRAWLSGPVTEWEEPASRRIDVPFDALPDGQRVVATVVFEEAPGDALRIWWEPDVPANPVPLAGEWTDGIRGWNQKSVLVSGELLQGGGNLVFETAGSSRKIHRLVLTHLERGNLFTSSALAAQEFYRVDGEVVGADALSGQPWMMPPDAWNGNVIEAHLQEFTESTQGGVEFVVGIEPAPQQAVLRFEINSLDVLPPGVWVNGVKLPHVSMEIPPFRSPTTVQAASGAGPLFPGWRAAWAHIPTGLLLEGENQFLITSGPHESFVRRTLVEMWYAAPVLSTETPPDFPDVVGESLEELPAPTQSETALEPSLPAWDPSAAPALQTIPAATELFRTSFR